VADKSISEILTHLGEERSKYFNAIAPPIIQTSNFLFESPEEFAEKIESEFDNHVYTRGNNPTVNILCQKLAALEKAEEALVLSSGASANAIAITSQLSAGDHIVCVNNAYDWTNKLLANILSRFGVTYTHVNGSDLNDIKAAIQPNTKVLVLESPSSKYFEIQDLKGCAAICKEHGIVSIIDNSHASPIFQNPISHGIDLVTHSATKYLNGHSDVVAGVICGSRNKITEIFAREFMTFGTIISPTEAAMILRGLRTLPLRIKKSDETAHQLATYLETHPKIKKVYHPLIDSAPRKALAEEQMSGNGGLFSILLNTEDISKIKAFCHSFERILLGVSWGGYESLFVPFYQFHGMDTTKADKPINFIRFYIGLEEYEYLKADFDKALAQL